VGGSGVTLSSKYEISRVKSLLSDPGNGEPKSSRVQVLASICVLGLIHGAFPAEPNSIDPPSTGWGDMREDAESSYQSRLLLHQAIDGFHATLSLI
jgi:hypothetical protein